MAVCNGLSQPRVAIETLEKGSEHLSSDWNSNPETLEYKVGMQVNTEESNNITTIIFSNEIYSDLSGISYV